MKNRITHLQLQLNEEDTRVIEKLKSGREVFEIRDVNHRNLNHWIRYRSQSGINKREKNARVKPELDKKA